MKSKKIGVVGGGQLAWMMGLAAKELNMDLIVQTPNSNDPAVCEAIDVILAKIDDAKATEKLADRCDIITFENEFINLPQLQLLENKGVCFRPSLNSLAPLLDKYDQRCYLQNIDLPVPKFSILATLNDINNITKFPVVLKARRHGYDGQGTFIVNNLEELKEIWSRYNKPQFLIEEFIPFTKELAVMIARNSLGEIAIYPVVETYQKDKVCRWVIAPANINNDLKETITTIARHLVESLQFIGILGIELFLTEDKKILVNEIAPRTHNSGHYTKDGCNISQFAMQLLAIADLPLTTPMLNSGGAVMVNLLGYENSSDSYLDRRNLISKIPNTFLEWYGKTESRVGRKLGHATTLLNEVELTRADRAIETIESLWYPQLEVMITE